MRLDRCPGSTFPTRIGLALALAFGALPPALALPTGEQVVSGQVAVGRPTAQNMVVQQGTGSAIVNWNSFSIGAAEGVQFLQPGASSVILNRVVQSNPSAIAGRLTANGRVFLVNPSGVLFARGASVDVGALVASTLDIRDADFLAGRYSFAGAGSGAVVNQGTLQAVERGTIALLGGQVSNEGTVTARLGTVALAAGNKVTLDFAGDGLTAIRVDEAAVGAQVRNSGMIVADGGQAVLTARAAEALAETVINQQGVVRARSLVERNGRIVLDGGDTGVTLVTGQLDASGRDPGLVGGNVAVLGHHVGLAGAAALDASGDAGGGTVLVGGDVRGQNPEVRNAEATFVGSDAAIHADALGTGAGGKVVVWSDKATRVHGTITANGGTRGGDGGFVETSGAFLDVAGARVSAYSPLGKAGEWLLDPNDITIIDVASEGSTSGVDTTPPPPELVFTANTTSATVLDTDVEAALNAGTSVTVASSDSTNGEFGNVTVAAGVSIDKTAGGDATLSLIALRNVVMEPASAIVSNSGRLNVVLRSDTNGSGVGGIWIQDGSSIVTNGGAVTLGGGVGGFAAAGFLEITNVDPLTLGLNEPIRVTASTIDTRSGIDPAVGGDFSAVAAYLANATLPATGTSAVRFSGSTVTTGSGNIAVVAASSGAGANANAGITMTPFGEGDSLLETTSGSITLTATSQGVSSRGIDLQFGAIRTSSGAVAITGLDAFSTGGTGVSIDGTTIATTGGGTIDVRGRGTGTGLFLAGDCLGDCTPARLITTGAPGSIILSGESTTGGAGLLIEGGAVVGDATTSGNIVLRATNAGGGDAIQLESSGQSALVQTVGGVINLRPGGVDFAGPLTPADSVPIDLLGGTGTGFNVSNADLAALQPGASAVVVGGTTHVGAITLFAPLTEATDFSLQNTGAGSAGIALNAALSAPGRTITLASAGPVTQTAPITAQNLVVSGPGAGDFVLTNLSNSVSVFASDPPASVQFVNSGPLVIGPVTGTGFDSETGFGIATNAPQAIVASTSEAVGSFSVRTLSGDLTLGQNVTTSGAGSRIDLVSAGIFNNAGSGTLTPGAGGSWRVWADTWVGETRGGLNPGNPQPNFYGCSYPGTCASEISIPATGNHFIYRQRPSATVTADSLSRLFGLPNPPLTFSVTGLLNGDSASDAAAGTLATPAVATSPAGDYSITGEFISPVGYLLDFVPGTLTVLPQRPSQPVYYTVIEYGQTQLYGRNLGVSNMCLATGPLLVSAEVDNPDQLDREWSRVRQLPNLTNCVEVAERHGCQDF